ncbi:other/AgaK1 protein kinase [Coprinellus micaceus]|uniref:Other/AgaK1 protein kinase n=1 Tax=Coprinellus micaceus TaxID=71717 RepID=A0A4Y7SP58_COPMI|nr:other/AgaK1 protein kinase [Coprinellus micaceus]
MSREEEPDPAQQSSKPLGPFEELDKTEIYWRDRYNWLLTRGYRLRSRYSPKWVPSWKTNPKLYAGLTEDSKRIPHGTLIDAICLTDASYVVLKRIVHAESPEEVPILQYFLQEPQCSDPRNHCIELLEVLHPPDEEGVSIIVLPVLRPYDNPDFDTIGEGLDFIRQMLEGLCFLHEHGVAHRDIRSSNFMLDGTNMYGETFHAWSPQRRFDGTTKIPLKQTRTSCQPKYFIIDFGFSKQYPLGAISPLEAPKYASDPSVPEFDYPSVPCNPFAADVYTFGNMIRIDFIDGDNGSYMQHGRKGFEFLRPLVDVMTQRNPGKRPTMPETLAKLDAIVAGLSKWKIRSRPIRIPGGGVIVPNTSDRIQTVVSHWKRKVKFVVGRQPPVPSMSGTAAASYSNPNTPVASHFEENTVEVDSSKSRGITEETPESG